MKLGILALGLLLGLGMAGAKAVLDTEAALRAGAEGPYRHREICFVRGNLEVCKVIR